MKEMESKIGREMERQRDGKIERWKDGEKDEKKKKDGKSGDIEKINTEIKREKKEWK